MFGKKFVQDFMRQTFLQDSPYEYRGHNTFRVTNFDNINHEDFADIYATGSPRAYWGKEPESAPKSKQPRYERVPYVATVAPWLMNRITGRRNAAWRRWQRSNAAGATVLMDNKEALLRSGAAYRPIEDYKMVRDIQTNLDAIRSGIHTMRDLAANDLKDEVTIVGYDVDPSDFHENNTAQAISLYGKIPLRWSALSDPNTQLKGILGSGRTYLSDRSRLYKDQNGTYLQTFERFAPDNWDYEGGNVWYVQAANDLRREPGKTVGLEFDGKGLMREFYFDGKSFKEIKDNASIPADVMPVVDNARWQIYKKNNGGIGRRQIR